jgi:hypothetical protein
MSRPFPPYRIPVHGWRVPAQPARSTNEHRQREASARRRRIVLPPADTKKAKKAYEEMKKDLDFDPRPGLGV